MYLSPEHSLPSSNLSFAFNLLYPDESDDIFQFVQRVLARFGPIDGARNKKGAVKRKFIDFQCAISDIVLSENSGSVKRMYL